MATAQVQLADHFADQEQQHESATFGMWLFLLTEVMLFGALFTVYAVYRWVFSDSFALASQRLDIGLGTLNTAILIASSLTMALAHAASLEGTRKQLVAFLTLTLLLGTAFLAIKAVEYSHKFHEHLVPGPRFRWEHAVLASGGAAQTAREPELDGAENSAAADGRQVELFFSLYFVMTGLHAAHMIIGLGVMVILIGRTALDRNVGRMVEMTGLYWHFVDIVWIFLFPMLYLIALHP